MTNSGIPVVLKFHSCPEIVLKSAIVLKFYSFGQNVLIWTSVMLSLHLCTSHDYVYVADVECQVMFSLVTLYCFMSNSALITFLALHCWSASMINIYEHRKTCIFCVLSFVKPTKVSWNFLKVWSWNFTSCCWEPCKLSCHVKVVCWQLANPGSCGKIQLKLFFCVCLC